LFEALRLDELLAPLDEGPVQVDEDEAPPPPPEPVSREGDLWALGNHLLLCGDSTSPESVERLQLSRGAPLVFTDPPYGVSFQSGMSKGGTATRFDVLQNDDTVLDVAPSVWSAMAEPGVAIVWTSHHVYPQWREQFASFYKSTIIWHKPGGGIGDLHGDYATDFEMALFCVKGRPTFKGKRGMAVWKVSKDNVNDYLHPTQKPVELASTAIRDWTSPGDLVVDLFGGSGSTLMACEQMARRGRIVELDPRFCDVIIERWQSHTGQQAILESDGRAYSELRAERL